MAVPSRAILARAAAKLGGVVELGARLDVSHRLLEHYIKGTEPIPDGLLLRAIDLIMEQPPDSPPSDRPDDP